MKSVLAGLLLFVSFITHAQVLTTATPYDLTSTLGAPASLPIRFDLTGRISFRLTNGDSTVFPLMTHFAWERQRYEFIPAVVGVKNEWVEAPREVPRLQVHRQKIEAGAGIGLALKLLTNRVGLTFGIVPFRGASWESRSFKKSLEDRYSLPTSVEEWQGWDVGEGRDYQVMGGLTVAFGASLMGLEAAQFFRTSEERWSLSLEKVSSQFLRVRVRLDNWKKRGRVYGPLVANWERAKLEYFDQERSYLVDMTREEGPDAVLALWAGRLSELQTSVATQEERTGRHWQGYYRARYLGIPYLFGQSTARVELQSWEDAGAVRSLGILNMQVRNKGIVREADPQVWTVVHDPSDSTMYFLAISQSLERGSRGVREKLGNWMEGMGMLMEWPTLSKKDFLDARLMFAVPLANWNEWSEQELATGEYQMLCQTAGLKCQKSRLARKAIERWDELRQGVTEHEILAKAEFLIRHPVMWRLLLSKAKDKIKAEFMAHGDRWMPMQRILTTP